jgi:hypothetical protein
MAERLGVVTTAEVKIDTLAERLRKEALHHTACLTRPPLIGAWNPGIARAFGIEDP